MKLVYSSLFILLIIAAASPAIIGNNIESQLQEAITEIEDASMYTVSIEQYESGYLNSNVDLIVSLKFDFITADMTDEEREEFQSITGFFQDGIPITLDIQHGPFLFVSERTFGATHTIISLTNGFPLPDVIASILEEQNYEVVASLSYGFDGDGEFVFSMPELSEENGSDLVAFGGVDLRADLEDWGLQYSLDGEIHASHVEADGGNTLIDIEPVTLETSIDMRDGLYSATGEMLMTFNGFSFSSDEGSAELNNIFINTLISNADDNNIDIVYDMGIEQLESSDMTDTLSNGIFKFSVKGLDKTALTSLSDKITNLDFSQDPEILQQEINTAMIQAYAGAEFGIESFSFQYGEEVSMNMAATLSVDPDIFTDPLFMQNPLVALPATTANLSLDFSQGLVDTLIEQFLRNQLSDQELSEQEIAEVIIMQQPQMSQMIGQLVQTGTLIATSTGYSAEVSLEGGNLLINGAPSNLPFF